MNVYSEYLARVKRNIHLVVCMSPMNTLFSNRLRMFPSLVNCSTIDWFTEWPAQALIGVGVAYLSNHSEELGFGDLLDRVVEALQYAHQTASKLSREFKAELGRHTHFTSTSYLNLLETYYHLFREKKGDY
jgi:dynein heavy chain